MVFYNHNISVIYSKRNLLKQNKIIKRWFICFHHLNVYRLPFLNNKGIVVSVSRDDKTKGTSERTKQHNELSCWVIFSCPFHVRVNTGKDTRTLLLKRVNRRIQQNYILLDV